MRSYTNKEGERIEVNKEHLDTAVEIKKQLQKSSPSGRCSWTLHKKYMEKEGFYDSENSENYRCMIKNYQKSIGELDSVESYAEMISEKKLESIKEAVGELYYAKREVQLENLKLNRLKRELSDKSILTESIIESFKDINIITPKSNIKYEEKDREILVSPSDWHIGFLDENFNFDIACEKIDKYIDKNVEYAKIFDVNTFHVVHTGDIVENSYMHKNSQSFNSEFTFSEQIVKATELLYYFIDSLSEFGNVVFYGVVRGNHGRMSNKGETLPKDCAEYIVNEGVKSLLSKTRKGNISVDLDGYNIERSIFEIKGKTIKAIHGDNEGQNDRTIIQKHISMEDRLIDLLCMGHFHNFRVVTENSGRMIYQSGCLQGSTDYSKSLNYNNTASQGLIVLSEDEIIPINIDLR